MSNETLDSLLGGKIKVIQSKYGYRFAIDAVILANFVHLRKKERVLELGTGCGIILIFLALKHPQVKKFFGLEIQKPLVYQAKRNVELNRLNEKIQILYANMKDVKKFFPPLSFDVVISNPPYYRLGAGRINPMAEKAIARHEIMGSLLDVAKICIHALREKGRLYLIYPSLRCVHLFSSLRRYRIEPKRIRWVYPREQERASFVLIEAIKGGSEEAKVEPPLFIYQGDGNYTKEVLCYYK